MALLGNVGDDYTRTGKGTLGRWSRSLSFVPNFPIIEKVILKPVMRLFGYVDTIIESAQWLFRGNIGSAATVLIAGTVSTTVNAISDSVFWWANAASGVTTGVSLGTHARAATEAVLGVATGALGVKPQVLRSYPAGIGAIGGGVTQSGPGKFASNISAERGQNADQAYANYMNGEGGVHMNELQSALGRG